MKAIGLAALAVLCSTMAQAQSRTEIYALQERCGKRAEQIFDKDFPTADRKGLEIFENHYSVRLNKCFLLESNTTMTSEGAKVITSKFLTLVDVNDNKVYGSFNPLACEVQEKSCRTEQDFRSLIKPFMED